MTKRCNRCLYNAGVPGITFDSEGVCNYCHIHDQLDREYPIGPEGMRKLRRLASEIKGAGRRKKYNVIVGVSGGCDSSYLLYVTKRLGLRPLAVHFDNTWNSTVAIENIHNVVGALDVDLETYVVDSGEYDNIYRSFLKSGTPDIDVPTDIALITTLYAAAEKHGVQYVCVGHSFRTEGVAPLGLVYMDGKYVESVQKQYGSRPLKTFPNLWLSDFLKWAVIKRIKRIRPLYYVDYIKKDVMAFLSDNLGWQWYGGHHLENLFCAFVHTYFYPRRYGADTRLWGYSALVRSGQMTREHGIELIQQPQEHDPELVETVKKRLGFSDKEFERVMTGPERTFRDFRTYKQTFEHTRWFWWLMYKLNRVPKSFYIKYTVPESNG